MLLQLDGKTYKARSPYELSLGDLIVLDVESTAMGYTLNLDVIEQLAADVQAITDPDPDRQRRKRGASTPGMLLFAVQVFASRRGAGELISFADAIDVKFIDVNVIKEADDPDDDLLGKDKRPTDHQTRKGSGRAAEPRAAASKSPRKRPAK